MKVLLTWDFKVDYMSLGRLSLFLRLPLAVLICSQLVYLSGNFSLDDYFVISAEEVVAFDERNDNKFFNAGLPVVPFKDALIQQADKVSLGLGSAPGDATLELHATGPPTA